MTRSRASRSGLPVNLALRWFAAVVGLAIALTGAATAGSLTPEQAAEHPGARVYKSKNCMACHKWHGLGGTGYGSTPVNLRETPLDLDQLVEVVACGRPGTGMPFHRKTAYEGYDCYGLSKEELGDALPGRANAFLSNREINAVAGFIEGFFKGRTTVADADCEIFFGVGSKTCRHFSMVGAGGSGGH